MKETGIIMSSDHPMKCLDGTKTVTRRTWGLDKINKDPNMWDCLDMVDGQPEFHDVGVWWTFRHKETGAYISIKCPYGGVGDILIMRETWGLVIHHTIGAERALILYKNGGETLWKPCSEDLFDRLYYGKEGAWHPSIHMPYEFSRGRFEILPGLRPERLQEITEEDAIKEGCQLIARTIQPFELKPSPHFTAPERPFTYRDHFIGIWDSINKPPYDWASNCWVWCLTFKREG